MSDQGEKIADRLYNLLVLHVQSVDAMEEHCRKVINKNYRTIALEKEAYVYFQDKYFQPVSSECKAFGLKYSDLLVIIPPPYATNVIQRHAILEDLKVFYKKEFGEYDLQA